MRSEWTALVRLAVPIATVQLAMMSMRFADVVMIGHYSSDALAAAGIGNSWTFLVFSFGMGTLFVLDPILAQALGAERRADFALGVRRGIVLAAVLGGVVSIPIWFADPALRLLGQSDDLVPLAEGYVHAALPAIPAMYVFLVIRMGLQALHRTRALLLVVIAANGLNLLLDWLWIWGGLGFPELGLTGCGIATSIASWVMAFGLLAVAWPEFTRGGTTRWRDACVVRPLLRMLSHGVPIGVQNGIEAAAFVSITLLMGHLGTTEVAGHQVAITLASYSFMLPLGVASAAAVRVGWAVGAADMPRARRAALAGLVTGGGVMTISGVAFIIAPEMLARLFTTEADVLAIATALLPLAGLFQVFDGLQVVAGGVLRGAGDTRIPMLIHLGGFWLTGIPLGVWLAFEAGQGPGGLWWGLVVGLGLVAGVFLLRIRAKLRGHVARLEVDRPATRGR